MIWIYVKTGGISCQSLIGLKQNWHWDFQDNCNIMNNKPQHETTMANRLLCCSSMSSWIIHDFSNMEIRVVNCEIWLGFLLFSSISNIDYLKWIDNEKNKSIMHFRTDLQYHLHPVELAFGPNRFSWNMC